jgi:hypothetical protein
VAVLDAVDPAVKVPAGGVTMIEGARGVTVSSTQGVVASSPNNESYVALNETVPTLIIANGSDGGIERASNTDLVLLPRSVPAQVVPDHQR